MILFNLLQEIARRNSNASATNKVGDIVAAVTKKGKTKADEGDDDYDDLFGESEKLMLKANK